jgi:hypothetical protein
MHFRYRHRAADPQRKTQSQLHLGKVNRWFLDEFEGFKFDTGDPPAQSKAAE